MTRLENYKGFYIDVDAKGVFHAYHLDERGYQGEQVAEAYMMVDLTMKLDKIHRTKLGQQVFLPAGNFKTGYRHGRVTSMKENKPYSGAATTVTFRVMFDDDVDKGWENTRAITLIKDTPENREIIKKLNRCEESIRVIEKQMQTLRQGLSHYTDAELLA